MWRVLIAHNDGIETAKTSVDIHTDVSSFIFIMVLMLVLPFFESGDGDSVGWLVTSCKMNAGIKE